MRLKLIVIHGWGGTFLEALSLIRGALDFPVSWSNGSFSVEKRVGTVLRRLLAVAHPGSAILAIQKLIISRFLAERDPDRADPDGGGGEPAMLFSEERLFADFAGLGLPLLPSARQRRAAALEAEAMEVVGPMLPMLTSLEGALRGADGRMAGEREARQIIREHTNMGDGNLVDLLETVRDMHESGGDLDTVASAVLYAYWLQSSCAKEGKTLEYGRDYRYVFLNYHEDLSCLAAHGPGDVYMADLPLGVFPDFEQQVRALAEQDVVVRRFEDHHPCNAEQRAMLARLVQEQVVGFSDLKGPLPGEELDAAKARCGADMVFHNVIAGQPWDCPGARTLQAAAHAEDFVQGRGELSKLLTELIKGGLCKTELAELLLVSIPGDDALQRLRERKMDRLAAFWRSAVAEIEEELLDNVFVVHLDRRPEAPPEQGGQALGPGSDVPDPRPAPDRDPGRIRVVMALAAKSPPVGPKMTIGRAVEFYARTFPDADYLFYFYGSSLMVARRLNQADFTLNLGALMPVLGGVGDGGHSGAAACRPEASVLYPRRLVGRVSPGEFLPMVKYMAWRLKTEGYPTRRIADHSALEHGRFRASGRKLLLVTVMAIGVGLLLLLLPAFRPARVLESNKGLLPQLDAAAAGSDRAAGDEEDGGW